MTDPHVPDPELHGVDAVGRAAAAGLRAHVDRHVDVDLALAGAPTTATPRPRNRFLAVAAAIALLAGSMALLERDDGTDGLDADLTLPDLEPGVLTPLGPRDGLDSIRLPLTVEPATGLADGQTVSVSAAGFVPGESVGIVQCAKLTPDQGPDARSGAEACDIGRYEPVTADAEGVASGTFDVVRLLTTPATGTVDCAAHVERCAVAMGAIADYDRSGVQSVDFDREGLPAIELDLPTVTASPTEGLSDGTTVRLQAEGLTPGDRLAVSVCAVDPSGCWDVGGLGEGEVQDHDGSYLYGLPVDDQGRVDAEVQVWQYLPVADMSGRYIDCAVSECVLRFSGQTVPGPVPLAFVSGGEGPVAGQLGVEPATGLAPGDVVAVAVAGLRPDTEVWFELCAHPVGQPEMLFTCASQQDDVLRTDGDGGLVTGFRIPDLGGTEVPVGGGLVCGETPGTCVNQEPEWQMVDDLRCDGVQVACSIRANVYDEDMGARPMFNPAPVPVTFR
ncbi:MAG: neocarzinostatin apoprotein domain-containing protein [Acidimicrobiales bacterium]